MDGSDLERRLGGAPPPQVVALGPEALATLDALLAEAERRQLEELTASLEHALRVVPRPLRPVIRKVVGA